MDTMQLRLVGTGSFFFIIFIFGIWLTISGKPYNGILLNIHKLVALAAGIFLVVTIYRINQAARISAAELAASVVTGLLFLSAGISGGLASIDTMPVVVVTLHRIAPFLTMLSTAATLYLLLNP